MLSTVDPDEKTRRSKLPGWLRRDRSAASELKEPIGLYAENRTSWFVLIGLSLVATLGFLLITRDRPTEVALISSGIESRLTLGGQSSSAVPDSIAFESLRRHAREGHELIAVAQRNGTIRSFRETNPPRGWQSRFLIDGGPKAAIFRSNEMVIRGFGLRRSQSDALFKLGLNLYGYELTGGLQSLGTRFDELIDQVDAVTLYEGDSLPEIASVAQSLAADSEAWLSESGDFVLPERRQLIEAEIDLANATAALAGSVSQGNLDVYNSAIDAYNRALARLNRAES